MNRGASIRIPQNLNSINRPMHIQRSSKILNKMWCETHVHTAASQMSGTLRPGQSGCQSCRCQYCRCISQSAQRHWTGLVLALPWGYKRSQARPVSSQWTWFTTVPAPTPPPPSPNDLPGKAARSHRLRCGWHHRSLPQGRVGRYLSSQHCNCNSQLPPKP